MDMIFSLTPDAPVSNFIVSHLKVSVNLFSASNPPLKDGAINLFILNPPKPKTGKYTFIAILNFLLIDIIFDIFLVH